MANLNGVYVDSATSYKGLLNLGASVGSNLSSTLQFITDGDNNSSALRVATSAVQVYNTTVDNAFSIVGTKEVAATFSTANIATSEKTFTFPNISGTFAFIDVAQTYTAQGAASTAAIALTGTPFVGTGTTSVPLFYLNGGAAPTTWNSTASGGTYLGINSIASFAGNFIDFRLNGGTSLFNVSSAGNVTAAGNIFSSASGSNRVGYNNNNYISLSALTLAGFGVLSFNGSDFVIGGGFTANSRNIYTTVPFCAGATSGLNASAVLGAISTTQGFLPPVMTTTQKNAISSPAAGLVVFDSTLGKLCVYGGAAWQTVTSVL